MVSKAKGKNGADDGRAAKLKERLDIQVDTMRGDVRDSVLRLVKELPEHWRKMTGGAQDAIIERIETLSSNLVDEAVSIVAGRGCEAHIVRLGKFTVNNGTLKGEFTLAASPEAIAAISARQNQDAALVARDADQFKGERAAAESDNIGTLAIPRKSMLASPTQPSEQPEAEAE